MGNRPKPTKLKLLQGNPGRRPINLDEPQPKPGIPKIPKWLKEFPIAVKEWKRESRELDEMGLLTKAESSILAMRCYLASEIQSMALEIKTEGRVAYVQKMDTLGNEIYEAKTNPKCVQIKNLITEYRQTGILLGLDPSSRSKLKVNPKKKKDEAEEFLGQGNGRQGN